MFRVMLNVTSFIQGVISNSICRYPP